MVASVSCIYGLGAPELYLQMTEEISIELTKEHIKKIKSKNDDLNAFVLLTEDLALERAAKADLRIQDKKNINKLTGIPYAAKDLYCTNGVRTTACSKALHETKSTLVLAAPSRHLLCHLQNKWVNFRDEKVKCTLSLAIGILS